MTCTVLQRIRDVSIFDGLSPSTVVHIAGVISKTNLLVFVALYMPNCIQVLTFQMSVTYTYDVAGLQEAVAQIINTSEIIHDILP